MKLASKAREMKDKAEYDSVVAATKAITVFLLLSNSVLVPTVMVLSWIYRYVTGRQPPGANQLDQVCMKLASKAREMKDKAENKIDGSATGDE
ncbi:hypothetical protein F0562_015398 [Nyssa sinensis]|uniref:Uncharacterized protein n=1 Tax=Nyssa sinensis TaxID=561372 RepID=A0A5J4ZJC3_9ASTE|nr:hypothetical protein F0562_015398 [Nyssa sinensis]